MIARFLTGAAIALPLLLSTPALAQESDAVSEDELRSLREELGALRSEIDALQSRLEAQQGVSAQADAKAAEALAAVQDSDGGTKIAWKGAPEFSSGDGWTFKPRGRLQYDFGHLSAPDGIADDGLGFTNELRRVRLGAEGTVPGGFGYRFELEFAEGSAQLWDGYITYGADGLTLTAGQHNNFQSLDELTSSNDTVLIERAAFTDAFGFERRLGLSAQYATGPVLLQGGAFTDNVADLANDGNDAFGVDGRAVFAPKLGGAQLHFGGSAHWRDVGDVATTGRYRQRPLIHSTDIRFIDTGNLADVESETSYGLEALAIAGRFHAAGEAHWLDVSRATAATAGFFGGYAELGYFLTDDSLGYRGGMLRAPSLDKRVGDGGIGALALSLRYDYLDMVDRAAGVVGGKQNGFLAGLSWWPSDNLRFLVNYGRLEYDDAALATPEGDRSYSADVLGARAQVSF